MKKIILIFVFAFSILFSIQATNHKGSLQIAEVSNFICDDDGCAGNCVRWAKSLVYEIADANNESPNDYQFYMDVYMRYYTGCYRGC